MSNWQPIETAPKDGTLIIVGCPGSPHLWDVGRWEKMKRVPDRWANSMGALPFTPTHWQPIPEPPELADFLEMEFPQPDKAER